MSKNTELKLSVTDVPEFKKFIDEIAELTKDINTPESVRIKLKQAFSNIGIEKYNLE